MEIFYSLRKAAQSRFRLMRFKSCFFNSRQFRRFAQIQTFSFRQTRNGKFFVVVCSVGNSADLRRDCCCNLLWKQKERFQRHCRRYCLYRGSFCHNSDFGFFLSAAQRNHAVVVLFKSAHVRRDNFPARFFVKKNKKASENALELSEADFPGNSG